MADSESALASALTELAALGTDRDREQLTALQDRLDAARLRVLVAGEAKRGKSTLVNALLGREVLPSGVIPLTAVTTTVRYGDDERAEVRFLDGHEEKQPLAALADLVTERGNPGNRRGIAGVTVYLAAPVLAGGVELVDTPGTGSVFEWDTETAHEALRSMDAAVFVLTADPPVSANERDLLGRVAGLSVATFAVLNKADHLDEAGLAEAAEFTRRVLGEAGHSVTVYPISARAALRGRDDGFAAFRADFLSYLSDRRHADLKASALGQARRIAGSLLDEVRLTRRAAGMRAGDAAQRVERFGARLAEVTVRGRDAVTPPSCSAWTWPCPSPKGGWPRAGGSSTRPARTWARPSSWPVRSGAGFPVSSAGARPGRTCAARSPTWWPVTSAGPGVTCSTGWPRRPGRWSGRSSSGTPTAPTGSGRRCGPRPGFARRPPPRRPRWNGSCPDERRGCVTSPACSTGSRRRAASMPAATPVPRGPGVLTRYTTGNCRVMSVRRSIISSLSSRSPATL